MDISDSHLVRRSLSRDFSLSDLVGRLRQKSRSSLSRDNSVTSRLSDYLKRDDSICSNLSEYCASECSEFSLELSCREESLSNAINCFADIEDELNTLKSSVNEIDEEFVRFISKPNPYLLKTTFSDYSLDSDSRPSSALDLSSSQKVRSHHQMNSGISTPGDLLEETEMDTAIGMACKAGRQKVIFDLHSPASSPARNERFLSHFERHLPPAVAYRKSKTILSSSLHQEKAKTLDFILESNNKNSENGKMQNRKASLQRTVTQVSIFNLYFDIT